MAINSTDFLATYPEFEEIFAVRPNVITAQLRTAQAFCSERLWGDRYAAGVYCKAAHLIAMTPFGENARLKGGVSTTYQAVFKEMVSALPVRVAVAGGFNGDCS